VKRTARVLRRLWKAALLATVVSLVWMCGAAVAQEGGPAMQVTVGFDGYCRYDDNGGAWCPVYVVLSNEGADVEGELRVAVGDVSGSTDPDVYVKRVVLPARSRKAYFLYLPSTDTYSRSHLTVELLASDGQDEVLSAQQVEVIWLDEEDWLCGVASSNPSALNFLSDAAIARRRGAVAHLSLETLPSNPLGWEGLDVLILNDVDTTVLSSEQRQALETWVVHGGHLIVGGGAGAARTVATVADLLPVAVDGIRSVHDLWMLGEQWSASVAAGPYAVAEASLRDGEAIIEQEDEQGDLILLARRNYGAGKVDFLAFDAGLNPFTHWNDNVRLWGFIVRSGSVGASWPSVSNGHRARDAVNAIPGLEAPSMLHILAFMLVYTLLIGPVNYVILRKLDRRELAWLTIPALIVGFTACAYVTGFQIRGDLAIVHRLAVVYVPEGMRVGRVSEVVGIFSPRRTAYDVWVASAGVREIPGGGGSAARPLHVIEKTEGCTVTGLRVDVGGIQSFVAEGYAEVPGIKTDLGLVVGAAGEMWLEGTVRNGEMLLKDVVLIVGDDERRLGDLEPGQVVSVHTAIGTALPPFEDMPERILGPGDYWNDHTLYRRYQFLQALFPYGKAVLKDSKVYLAGWAEEDCPLLAEVVERPFSTVETALYLYALPVAGLEAGTTVTIPPGLIERQVEETTSYVDVRSEGFRLEPGVEIVFRFTVWPGVRVRQVDELVLNMWGSSNGNMAHPPTVSLWNWKSGAWERLDDGWGQHSIPSGGAYLSSLGDLRLRLEADAEWPADVEGLTIMIRGQR